MLGVGVVVLVVVLQLGREDASECVWCTCQDLPHDLGRIDVSQRHSRATTHEQAQVEIRHLDSQSNDRVDHLVLYHIKTVSENKLVW